MTVTSNDPDEGSIDIVLTGTLPALGADIEVAPSVEVSLDPAFVTIFDVDVDNIGGTELTITGTKFIGDDAGAFTATFVPATIPANGGFDFITIEFDPTGVGPGAVDAALQIMSNDASEFGVRFVKDF